MLNLSSCQREAVTSCCPVSPMNPKAWKSPAHVRVKNKQLFFVLKQTGNYLESRHDNRQGSLSVRVCSLWLQEGASEKLIPFEVTKADVMGNSSSDSNTEGTFHFHHPFSSDCYSTLLITITTVTSGLAIRHASRCCGHDTASRQPQRKFYLDIFWDFADN